MFSSLQKFKLLTASTIISSENASLETMGTDQLLDLFHLDNNKGIRPSASSSDPDGPATMKTILENLPDLWDDQQYETEYDMANFVKNLRKNWSSASRPRQHWKKLLLNTYLVEQRKVIIYLCTDLTRGDSY